MFPRRAGAAAALPLTLQDCFVQLRADADGGPNDLYITGLIQSAVRSCEERIGLTLISTPWKLTLDAFPSGAIQLRMGR